jgi:hypothetical protein
MKKPFALQILWSECTKNLVGLPRPFIELPNKYRFTVKGKFRLHAKVPIPWQSVVCLTEDNGILGVDREKEHQIFESDLCGFCGEKIGQEEDVVRWTAVWSSIQTELNLINRVQSDCHPFHLDCMKQSKIFCPYMRERPNTEFEHGKFKDLKLNAREDVKNHFKTRFG